MKQPDALCAQPLDLAPLSCLDEQRRGRRAEDTVIGDAVVLESRDDLAAGLLDVFSKLVDTPSSTRCIRSPPQLGFE